MLEDDQVEAPSEGRRPGPVVPIAGGGRPLAGARSSRRLSAARTRCSFRMVSDMSDIADGSVPPGGGYRRAMQTAWPRAQWDLRTGRPRAHDAPGNTGG